MAVTPSSESALELDRHPHRVAQVVAVEARDRRPGVVPLAGPGLQAGWASTRLTTVASRPDAAGEDEVPAVDRARGRSCADGSRRRCAIRCSVASTTSLGMPSVRATTLVEPPGQHRDRDIRAGQPVGDLVQGAVTAERDDDVVAAVARLAADLDRVLRGLGVDGLDLVAGLERVDDEVLEPVRDGRRVGVDDDQHPLLLARRGRAAGRCAERGSAGRGDRRRHDRSNPSSQRVTAGHQVPERSRPAPVRGRLVADAPRRPRPRGRARRRPAGRRGRSPRRGSGRPG